MNCHAAARFSGDAAFVIQSDPSPAGTPPPPLIDGSGAVRDA